MVVVGGGGGVRWGRGRLVAEDETSVSPEALAPNGCDERRGNCLGAYEEETVDGRTEGGRGRRRKRRGGGRGGGGRGTKSLIKRDEGMGTGDRDRNRAV